MLRAKKNILIMNQERMKENNKLKIGKQSPEKEINCVIMNMIVFGFLYVQFIILLFQ